MKRTLTLIIAFAIIAVAAASFAKTGGKLEYGETKYDFGYIGIDYTGYYDFPLYNGGDEPVIIKGAGASCDCSRVSVKDTLIEPGDTVTVRLSYNTRKFRGPTMQTFTVETDDPKAPAITVAYSSVVGQWVEGVKPDPLSLFFLPGQKPKEIVIANPKYSKMTASYLDQADTLYTVKLIDDNAGRGGAVKIEVAPHDGIAAGTYDSSFRVQVEVTGIEEPIVLTIPVKIVRY
jgi:hypothetical protein